MTSNIYTAVCMANYCRSPVAQHLLKHRFTNLNFDSAGIQPISRPHMDRRSEKFLKSLSIDGLEHFPKRISKKIISNSKVVFALDPMVLMQLNKMFPNESKKFLLLNYKDSKNIIYDPYTMDDDSYMDVMKNIQNIVENLDLD